MAENATAAKVNNIKALRDEINSLKASLANMAQTGEDCAQTTQDLYNAEKELASAMAVRKGEQNASATSIAGMEQNLKALQGTLRALSDEQKKADWAQTMVKEAEEVSESLNKAKQQIGDYRNNIGRYAESIDDAFGKMGVSVNNLTGPLKATSSVTKDLGGALRELFKNPWALMFMVIVEVVREVVKAFKNNEEAMQKLRAAMEPLKPILTFFSNIMGILAEKVATVAGWIAVKLANAFTWLLKSIPTIVNKIIDGLNVLGTPIRMMVAEVKTLLNVIKGFKDGGIKGAAKAFKDFGKTLSDTKIGHMSTDLTKLTEVANGTMEAVKSVNEATEDNIDITEKASAALGKYTTVTETATTSTKKNTTSTKENTTSTKENTTSKERNTTATNNQKTAVQNSTTKTKEHYEKVDKDTDSVDANTAAIDQNADAAARAMEQRLQQIEELKKKIDENDKSERQKLKERYEEERELIKGNAEYEAKLKAQYNKKVAALDAKTAHSEFSYEVYRANRDAMFGPDGQPYDTETYLSAIISAYEDLQSQWGIESYKYLGGDSHQMAFSNINMTPEQQNEALNRMSMLLLGIPYDALENPEGYINLTKAVEDWEDTIKDFKDRLDEVKRENLVNAGNEAIGRINGKTGSFTSRWLDLFGLRTDLEESEIEKEINTTLLPWIKTIGKDVVGAELAMEREYRDREFSWTSYVLGQSIEAYEAELENFKGTEEQKTELIAEQSELRTQLRELELEHQIDINNRAIEDNERWKQAVERGVKGVVNILDNIGDAWEDSVNRQIASKKKSQEWGDKQFKEIQRLQSATAMINALLSANEAYSSLASIPYVGPALGAAAAAAALAAGIANVRLINAQNKNGANGDTSASIATIPSMVDTSPFEYTRTLNTEEEEAQLNRPVWVSVRDIERGLNQAYVTDKESTF